jgi:hypothetical protein
VLLKELQCEDMRYYVKYAGMYDVQGASVNRPILQHGFFSFGNAGVEAAVAILLPTLKRFSCNGAVDWSAACFCCKGVLQKR